MKSTEVLDRVKAALGIEVALEQRKLENGTILEADKFEAEEPVFIVTDDEKVALPVGEYQMEDGTILAVADEGIISDIIEKVAEEVDEAKEESTEVEAAEEEKEEMGYVTKEELGAAVDEIKAMIEEMRSEVEAGYGKKKEDMSEETSEQDELKEELSKAAVKPLRHSPEKNVERVEQVRFARNRAKTTFDIVLEKLNS